MLPSIETSDTYPYLVLRLIPAAYAFQPVTFIDEPPVPSELRVAQRRNSPAAREAVLQAATVRVVKLGLRVCVVFGPENCVFIELDGSRSTSTKRPSGGVRLDNVKVK